MTPGLMCGDKRTPRNQPQRNRAGLWAKSPCCSGASHLSSPDELSNLVVSPGSTEAAKVQENFALTLNKDDNYTLIKHEMLLLNFI